MYSQEQENKFIEKSKDFIQKEVQSADIELLRQIIRYHEWRYHIKNDPVIADYEYDQLYKSLEQIEVNHPDLVVSDSPTQRVSSDLSSDFPSVAHIVPMLSLDNSYDAADLRKFDEQVRKAAGLAPEEAIEYSIEPKYDGGSVALLYRNDQFYRAATRGNGVEGEDITQNVKVLPTIPLRANFSNYNIYEAELRGEAVIAKKRFTELNEERESNGLSLFANPRNSAAGGLRMKNPVETRDRGIEIFIFQLGHAADENGNDRLEEFNSHSIQLKILGQLGFKIEDHEEFVCRDIESVIQNVTAWEQGREEYPYEIDGMVVKVDKREIQELCGSTQHHPKWAIAFKFKAKQATTVLEKVEYQVGKIGSITPVAKVTPTQLAGVTVSSISLHNEEFIKGKDLRIGDRIVIERAGDVIPYIVKALPDLRNGSELEIEFPQFCPINSEEEVRLIRVEGEAAWRCPNCTCSAQNLQKIIFHVSKSAMDIDGFGRSFVERFYELGWLRDIGDVYDLDYEEIAKLEGFGTRSAQNLKKSIEKAKSNSLSRLLHSLSIHHLGKKASRLLAQEVESVFDLEHWTMDDFLGIKDIGPVVAQNVMEYFSNENNIVLLQKMESLGVNMLQTSADRPKVIATDAPLKGKTILFTGTLTKMTRNQAKEFAEELGATNISGVSKNLNILVAGEKAGSKLKKAQDLGTVQILSEDEFLAFK